MFVELVEAATPKTLRYSTMIIRWLLVVLIACAVSNGLTTSQNSVSLMDDVLTDSMERWGLPSHILYVTFVSNNIASYSGFVQHFNRAYFEASNSSIRYFTEETGHNYHPSDMRWNKVPIIIELLHRFLAAPSAASPTQYIAFFDADILFLRPNFLDDVLARRRGEWEVLLSEDLLDVANSGFIVARVSTWSLQFFKRWWEMRHHANTFCDQHVLNALSLQLANEGQLHKMALLPFGVINSQWPPLEHFDPSKDNVLHLLGEFDFVRQAVAQYFVEQQTIFNKDKDGRSVDAADVMKVKVTALTTAFREALARGDILQCIDITSHVCEMQLRLEGKENHLGIGDDFSGSFVDALSSFLTDVESQATPMTRSALNVQWLQLMALRLKCFPLSEVVSRSSSTTSSSSVRVAMPIRSILKRLESLSDDASRPSNAAEYVQQRLSIYETMADRVQKVLSVDLARIPAIEDRHDQRYLWKKAATYAELSKNESLKLLHSAPSARDGQSEEVNSFQSFIRLQHLKQLQRQVELHLLKPTYFGYFERNNAWERAHEVCDEAMPLIEELQSSYVGEVRLLVDQVQKILRPCVGLYEKRRDTRAFAQELTTFLQEMRYYARPEYLR